MKLKSVFFLIVFTGFLVTPAVVAVTKMQIDLVSYFASSEEENSDTLEFGANAKINLLQQESVDFTIMELFQSNTLPRSSDDVTSAYSEIFSPPPEIIL